MTFLDYLISVDARTALMGRMMQKLGVDKQLKSVPSVSLTRVDANRPFADDRFYISRDQAVWTTYFF